MCIYICLSGTLRGDGGGGVDWWCVRERLNVAGSQAGFAFPFCACVCVCVCVCVWGGNFLSELVFDCVGHDGQDG